MAWDRLPGQPGFYIHDGKGRAEAYFAIRPEQHVIDEIWKVRYSDYVQDIDDGLNAVFPITEG